MKQSFDEIRKMVMDEVDDDVVARKLIAKIKLSEELVSEREWNLEDQLLKIKTEGNQNERK